MRPGSGTRSGMGMNRQLGRGLPRLRLMTLLVLVAALLTGAVLQQVWPVRIGGRQQPVVLSGSSPSGRPSQPLLATEPVAAPSRAEPQLAPTDAPLSATNGTAAATLTLPPAASEALPPATVIVTPTLLPTVAPTLTPSPTPSPSPTPTPASAETPSLEAPTAGSGAPPPSEPTPDGVERVVDVPILMYHYVSSPPADADDVRRDLSVSPELFSAHLTALQNAGYTAISLEDVTLALTQGVALPANPIVLTFDDGYRDAYENAYPILQQHGMQGTFFLLTSVIDQGNPVYLSWEQVTEMSAGGMAMEAHSYTHEGLFGRDRDFLIWQMLGSKEAIEERTGRPVRFFCYPSGYYDEQAGQVLQELGYWAATTTEYGLSHSTNGRYALSRVRVRGSYSPEHLLLVLEELFRS
jgi:peptidoglycan/xylan/chitin deacetylase (PgdA/CDA1 family)